MSRWRVAARAVRDALLGERSLDLLGRRVRVVPTARGLRADRDYEVLLALVAGRSTVWDIGANLGLTSILAAASMADGGRVVAVEASEAACRLVRRHAEINGVADRVDVIEAVVGARSGALLDFHWDHASGGASVIAGYLGERELVRKVALALDDLLAAERAASHQAPEVIKLDIEGAERDALVGARALLTNARPTILLELHSWRGTSLAENAASVLEVLESVGYQMIYLRSRGRVRDVEILADRGRCHVLLLPVDAEWPAALDAVETGGL